MQASHQKRQGFSYWIGAFCFLLFSFRLIVLGETSEDSQRSKCTLHGMATLKMELMFFINNFKVTNISLTITAIQWYSFGISQFHFCVLFIRNGSKVELVWIFYAMGLLGTVAMFFTCRRLTVHGSRNNKMVTNPNCTPRVTQPL